MQLIDTHSHLYLDKFKKDIDLVIQNAKTNKLSKILLPNIDKASVAQIFDLYNKDKSFFSPMMGLHPTSVDADYQTTLDFILKEEHLADVCAIGEIGLDFYWSKEFKIQQIEAFEYQIDFAKKRNLPIAIHCREAFDEVLDILEKKNDDKLKGVLHCFTGNKNQAERLIEMGFYLGIGGVLTYKNSGLDKVIENIDLKHLMLETDAPFLPPVPFRGKRNESSYTIYVAEKLAEIKNEPLANICAITSKHAIELFKLEF